MMVTSYVITVNCFYGCFCECIPERVYCKFGMICYANVNYGNFYIRFIWNQMFYRVVSNINIGSGVILIVLGLYYQTSVI